MTTPGHHPAVEGRGRTAALTTGFALLYVLAMVAGRATRVPPSELALAWPAAGVTMAWFLSATGWRGRMVVVAIVTALSGWVNVSTGVEPVGAWLFGLVNAAHGWVGALVFARVRRATGIRPVTDLRDVVALALASLAAATASAVSGGLVAWLRFGSGLWDGVGLIGFRNALSSFVVLNALLAVPRLRPSLSARPARCAALVTGSAALTALVLSSSWPVAFVIIPALLVVALRCGPHVTSVLVAVQGALVVAATALGWGTFAVLASAEARVVLAQLFILVLSLIGLVIAVLEEARVVALAESRAHRDRWRRHMEAALVPAGHLVLGADGRARTDAVNAALEALTNRPRADLIDADPVGWLIDEDAVLMAEGLRSLASGAHAAWRGQLRLSAAWGGAWVDVALAMVDDDEPTTPSDDGGARPRTLVKLQMIDITAQKEAEASLAHAALHDELTGLANRTLWADRLDQAMRTTRRTGVPAVVMYVDVDRFKQINDTYGHAVGDEVLKEVARRIAHLVRPQDTVARIGGDEFVILCPDVVGEEDGQHLADRIQRQLRNPVLLADGRQVVVTTSIGVAQADADDADARLLLRRADIALYTAKQLGRARFEVYTPSLHAGVEASARLLLDLERGQAAGEFSLVYQPIVDAASGRLVAVEALLRWNHPERGCVLPGEFLDVLEGSELVHEVGSDVLRGACRDGARLNRTRGPVAVHVNVSARELTRPRLVERVRAAVDEAGLDPSLLVLEITETRLLTVNGSLVRDLFALRSLGVRIAMDDFGTGFSTLTHLVDLPVDIVKLDAAFVADILTSRSARSVSTGLQAMAAGLGIEAVAEGVESEAQADALRATGYRLLQGYHLGRPAPLDDLTAPVASG